MKPDTIIIRYGEIGLKSRQVRRLFINKLLQNMKAALRSEFVDYTGIHKEYGRLFVETDEKTALGVLSKVFGIVSISPAYTCNPNMDDIREIALQLAKKHIKKTDTFAIRARRSGSHNFTSEDIGVQIGEVVRLKTKAKVALKNPKKELFIEIRQKRGYVFLEKISGPGGLPMGIEGKVAVLYENKNSLLAAWLMAKRGCDVKFICRENKKQALNKNLKLLKPWFGETKIQALKDPLSEADKTGSVALVSAGVLGSNLEKSLLKFQNEDSNANLPIFRPLVGLNKTQLAALRKRISA